MDIGSGIAIASICAVIIAGILKITPSNNNSKPILGNNVSRETCEARHSSLKEALAEIHKRLGNLERMVQEVLRRGAG